MSVLGQKTISIPRLFGPNVGPSPSQHLGRHCHPLPQLWTLGLTSSGQLMYPQQPPVRPQTEAPLRPPHLAQISVCLCAPVTKRICFKCTTRLLKLPKNATPAANPHSSNLNCSPWFSTASSLPWKRDLDKNDLVEVPLIIEALTMTWSFKSSGSTSLWDDVVEHRFNHKLFDPPGGCIGIWRTFGRKKEPLHLLREETNNKREAFFVLPQLSAITTQYTNYYMLHFILCLLYYTQMRTKKE